MANARLTLRGRLEQRTLALPLVGARASTSPARRSPLSISIDIVAIRHARRGRRFQHIELTHVKMNAVKGVAPVAIRNLNLVAFDAVDLCVAVKCDLGVRIFDRLADFSRFPLHRRPYVGDNPIGIIDDRH